MTQFGGYTSGRGSQPKATDFEDDSEKKTVLKPEVIVEPEIKFDEFVKTILQRASSNDILREIKEKNIDIYKPKTIEDKKVAIEYLTKLIGSDAPDFMIDFWKAISIQYKESIAKSKESEEPPEIKSARLELIKLSEIQKDIENTIRNIETQRYNKEISEDEFKLKKRIFGEELNKILDKSKELKFLIYNFENGIELNGETPEVAEARFVIKELKTSRKIAQQKLDDLVSHKSEYSQKEYSHKYQTYNSMLSHIDIQYEKYMKVITDYERSLRDNSRIIKTPMVQNSSNTPECSTIPKTQDANTIETRSQKLSDIGKIETTTEKDSKDIFVSEKVVPSDKDIPSKE